MATLDLNGPVHPAPETVNFSIAIVFAQVDRTKSFTSLPNIPSQTVQSFQQHANTLLQFKIANELTAALKPPLNSAETLSDWICKAVGDKIIPATGDLEIRAMPREVRQFIMAKQHPVLQRLFDASMAAASNKSCLAFHGTDIGNVASILQRGLTLPFSLETVAQVDRFAWQPSPAIPGALALNGFVVLGVPPGRVGRTALTRLVVFY